MKVEKFVMICNDGLYVGKNDVNVFSKEELIKELVEWSEDNVIELDGEEVSVNELFEGIKNYKGEVCCDSMCEYGDDFVELMIVELLEK